MGHKIMINTVADPRGRRGNRANPPPLELIYYIVTCEKY